MKKKIYKLNELIIGSSWPSGVHHGPFTSEYSAIKYAAKREIIDYHISSHCFCYLYRKKIADLWHKQYFGTLEPWQERRLKKYYKYGLIRYAQSLFSRGKD